jgi:hypothetical protein
VESSTHASDLALLEQAELAAREQRLSASADAEAIILSGQERAAAISAGSDARIADALERLRERLTAEADSAIAALERDAQARARTRAEPPERDPAATRAVDLVVAAVLGESSTGID